MDIQLRLALFLLLISTNISDCSEMKLQQLIKFDLFSVDNSTLSTYLTKVSVGTPPQTLNVVVDTGSNLSWLDCSDIGLNTFNVSESSTASIIYCSKGTACKFTIPYYDGSLASGYMVSDMMHFSISPAISPSSRLSARIIFGCSTFKTLNSHIHGIIGLGRTKESLVSQLFSQNVAPRVISHCLSSKGDGYLLLGDVVEYAVAYTPLIPAQEHYQVSIDSFLVNGKRIDATSSKGIDTIVDSGTTLTLLEAGIYDPLVNAVSAALNKSTAPLHAQGCYEVPSRDSFPQITINLVNGTLILLMPEDYVQFDTYTHRWCLGFRRDEAITILGDMVLRDKIVVYDQPHERIGFLSRDCSQPVNVSLHYTSGSSSITLRVAAASAAPCWGTILMIVVAWFIFP